MSNPQKIRIEDKWRPLMAGSRKPAKECCCSPAIDCCLYPWPDPDAILSDTLYPPEDLPDEVRVESSLPEWEDFVGVYTRSGYEFQGPMLPSTAVAWIVPKSPDFPGSENWMLVQRLGGLDVVMSISPCLITEDLNLQIEDEFKDTYTLKATGPYPPGTECALNRVSLCRWEGVLEYINDFEESVAIDVSLNYQQLADDVGGVKCGWFFYIDPVVCYVKEDPQSSPVGVYSADAWPSPFTSGGAYEIAE